MFSCHLVFCNARSYIESSILSFVLLIINLQPATRRTYCWKALEKKKKNLTVRKKNLEKNCRKKNWKKIVKQKNWKKIVEKKIWPSNFEKKFFF